MKRESIDFVMPMIATGLIWVCATALIPLSVLIAPFDPNIGSHIMTAAALSTSAIWVAYTALRWRKTTNTPTKIPKQEDLKELNERVANLETMDRFERSLETREEIRNI